MFKKGVMGFFIVKLLSLYFLLIQARESSQGCVKSVIGNNEYFTACRCKISRVLALSCHDIGPDEHMNLDVTYTFCFDCEYPKRVEIIRWNKENIDNNSLYNLPSNFQYLVLNLRISSSKISNITSATFSAYKGLKELYLDHNEYLSTLERGVFSEQSALEYLDLSNNNLESFFDGLFLTDKNITTLKLNNNKINYIHADSFYNLPNIKKIYLGSNNISSITSLIFRRQKLLTYLDLSQNSIKIIEQHSFENVTNLEEIYLQNNQIITIPRGLFQKQKNLKIVNLSNNPIITLFQLNQFIGNPGSLKKLSLDNFFHSDLILENINSAKNLSGLSFLSLTHNNILSIANNAFSTPKHLQFIDLSHNQIKYINKNAFDQLLNLSTLKLNNNNIEKLFHGTFLFLDELSELDLSYNKLRSFPLELLDSCSKLRILRLSHNRLHYLSKLNLELLNKLEILEIDNNALTQLDGISSLPNLKTIAIENNNWSCLELLNFIDTLEEKSVKIRQVAPDPRMDHHIRHISCEYQESDVDSEETTTMKPFREDYYEKYFEKMPSLFDKFARNINGIINNGDLVSELHDDRDHFENITKILILQNSRTESNYSNVFNYIFLFTGLSLLVIVSVGALFILYKLRNKNTKEYILAAGLSNPIS